MNETIISRRKFLKAASIAGAGAMLAACAPATQTPAATQSPVSSDSETTTGNLTSEEITLNVLAENWGEIYNNLMTVIGDEFTKEHPNIKVSWDFDPDWRTKLTTLLAANTPPDLAFMRSDFITTVASKGVVLPLDDFLKAAGAKREDFVLPLYDSSLYNGKLYAMPGGADFWNPFYSKDMYRAAGLDPEQPPKTLQEFFEHSKKLVKTAADGSIEQLAYLYTAWQYANWAFIYGGEFYDAEKDQVTADHPKNIEAMKWLREYWMSEGNIDQLTAFAQRPGFFEAGNPFATKQCAFVFDGFWFYEAIDQHAPDLDYGVAFWPTLTGSEADRSRYMVGGWMYSLPKGIPHVNESWALMRYMFLDNSAKMGVDTLNGTCVKAQFDEWVEGMKKKLGESNRMSPYLHLFVETGGYATKYFPAIPVQSFYSDELNRVWDLVMRDQLEPEQALAEVRQNVQAELEKSRKESSS